MRYLSENFWIFNRKLWNEPQANRRLRSFLGTGTTAEFEELVRLSLLSLSVFSCPLSSAGIASKHKVHLSRASNRWHQSTAPAARLRPTAAVTILQMFLSFLSNMWTICPWFCIGNSAIFPRTGGFPTACSTGCGNVLLPLMDGCVVLAVWPLFLHIFTKDRCNFVYLTEKRLQIYVNSAARVPAHG